jgi:RNA polymerase sigma-70 factor, ECF subfamily
LGLSQRSIDSQVFNQRLEALVKQIAAGDQNALAALYDLTSRQVYGLILRVMNDTSLAEEVTLDVYTQVWRQAGNYDSQRGTPLTWLMIMARCRAIDRLRAGRLEYQRTEPLELSVNEQALDASPEESTLIAERQKLVRSALENLSLEQREVIELAYYSGLSHSEIAEKLAQPLGTIKTRIRAAMMKLKELLKPLIEEQIS